MSRYSSKSVIEKQNSVLPEWKPYDNSILPLLVCKAEPITKGIFTYRFYYDQTFTLWCGFFYIKNVDGKNILIDTGPTTEDFINKGFPVEGIMTAEESLKKGAGLSPENIDIVIYTHLHHDHCPNAGLFKNAKHIIQEDEWAAVHNPPACYRDLYNPEYVDCITPTLINGDMFNVASGIHILYTPGHTPGGQSIIVDTKAGRAIICGFCCDTINFNPPEELRKFWPEALVPGLHVNSEDAYDSVLRVKNEADYIIVLHDEDVYKSGALPNEEWRKK